MARKSCHCNVFVSIMIFVFNLFPETANITASHNKSQSPSCSGREEWTYTLDGEFYRGIFSFVDEDNNKYRLPQSFSCGIWTPFTTRFKLVVVDTRAELTVLELKRSDAGKYNFMVHSTGHGTIDEMVILVVNDCKY